MAVMEREHHTVVIVGGGISGMAAAYAVQEAANASGQPVSFTLIEASERLGGKIITEQVDGFTIEGGPDCFLRQKPWAGELCLKLGLSDDLRGTNDHQRKVYVLDRGKLSALPDGVMLIVPTRIWPFVTSSLISWPGKIRMGMDLLIRAFKGDGDESVGAFVRRRLGREALEKIAEPLMSGIHVSDPEEQSLLATFPRFRGLEQKHGSLIKGMLAERRAAAARKKLPAGPPSKIPTSIFVTLRGGLGQMVSALEQKLTGGRVLTGVKVTSIEKSASGGYEVTLDRGSVVRADAVILATPSYTAAGLLRRLAPAAIDLLEGIRYVSTATVSLAFRKTDIRKPFMGFGFVVPKKEKRKVSACTWTSFKFNHRSPEDHLLLRCFVGGPGQEELVDLDDDQMLSLVRRELKEVLKIEAAPVLTRIFRWHEANPQYHVGHLDRVKEIHAALEAAPGIFVTGSAYEGVGVPDCIRQGQEAARKALQFVFRERPELAPAE